MISGYKQICFQSSNMPQQRTRLILRYLIFKLWKHKLTNQPWSCLTQILLSAVYILRWNAPVRLIWAIWWQSHSHNKREPVVHEWTASLNEQEHSPVLPSNRETGCLSDTWIKMDALYFPPCSVREQGETDGEWKEGRRKNGDRHAGGMKESIRRGWMKEKQRAVFSIGLG